MVAVIGIPSQLQFILRVIIVVNTPNDQRTQRRLKKKQQKEAQRLQRANRMNQKPEQIPHPKPNPQPLTAKTENQLKLIRAINTHDQVIAVGCAGTGKSFIPAAMAADMLSSGAIEKVIMTRPMVSVGKSMGFLPGDMNEKGAPWMVPLMDPLVGRLGKGFVDYCMRTGKIEVVPFELIRGRTWRNAFVIVDEAQNCTFHQLKAVVTRMGEGSKLVMDGDIAQADNPHSGLAPIVRLAQKYDIDCITVEFGLEDVVRSGLVKQWLTAFHRERL